MSVWGQRRAMLRAIYDWWHGADSTPYVAELQVIDNRDYSRLELGKYRGLVHVQVVGGGSAPWHLLTFWKRQEDCTHGLPAFCEEVKVLAGGVAPTVGWQGAFQAARTTVSRWSWKGIVTAVVAFLGWGSFAGLFAFYGFVERGKEVLSAPAIEVMAPDQPVRVLVGQVAEVKFQVRNTSSYSTSNIHLREPTIVNQDGQPTQGLKLRQVVDPDIPDLKPRDLDSFVVKADALKPGKYRLKVTCFADVKETGRQTKRPAEAAIEVWPACALGQRALGPWDGRKCAADLELQVGQKFARGLDLEVWVIKEPGIRIDDVSFPDLEKVTDRDPGRAAGASPVPADRAATFIQWRTFGLSPLDTVPFRLYLVNEGKTDLRRQDWQRILEKLRLNCAPVRREVVP
jgi:hypothetical protein